MYIVNCSAQSIDILLKEATENNPELKALENEYFAALEKAPQVSQLPDPELGAGGFVLPVETRLGAQLVRVSATQMFPWFGTIAAKEELEKTKAKAVYEKIEARKLDLFFKIKQAYFQLYEMQESQAVLASKLRILTALERTALAKVESGKGSAADVLRVQLKQEELKERIKIIENSARKPRIEINQLLNRPLDTPVTVSEKLNFADIPFHRDSLKKVISANHPLLRMYERQKDISRQSLLVNALDGKPSFGAGIDYIAVNPRTDADPANNGRDILQLRAAVRIPIYRKKYAAKTREENFKIAAVDYQKEETLNRFLAIIEKAFTEYETARLQINLYQKQTSLTEATMNILEADYSSTGNRFDELLGLETDLIDYDLKILKAIVQSHQAKNEIERLFF